jgi:uncharacterized protein (TIGR02145 family)
MRNNLSNVRANSIRPLLAATLALAITFTLSCSGGEDPPPPDNPPDNGGGWLQSCAEVAGLTASCSYKAYDAYEKCVAETGYASDACNETEDAEYSKCVVSSGSCNGTSFETCMGHYENMGCFEDGGEPPSSNSNGNQQTFGYCDFGPITQYGGGCFEMISEDDCDLRYGKVVSACTTYPKCGDKEYNSSTQFCCGGNTYNSSTMFCSGSTAYAKCNGAEYDVAKEMCDTRDSKKYKITKIGTQTWMAENLNYNASGSKCYDNSNANCTQYGRLYDWATAMAISSTYNSSSYSASAKHKGACPTGWHLPSDAEWETLVNYAGTNPGTKLKAKSGWDNNGNGTDTYGFSALPGGTGYSNGSFVNVGNGGNWWSATENAASSAYRRDMFCSLANVYRDDYDRTYLYSVRCVQD